ncbi:MAG: hypothetical protein Q9173_006959 [Seirophora scorigena]
MSDAEGDSQMQSSSEASSEDLNAMFPEANESANAPQTPLSSNVQNLQQFSELSPPASEGPGDPQLPARDLGDPTNGAESAGLAENYGGGGLMAGPPQQLSIAEREPGASWNTRKHQDEEARVKELLLDSTFSLSEDFKTPATPPKRVLSAMDNLQLVQQHGGINSKSF